MECRTWFFCFRVSAIWKPTVRRLAGGAGLLALFRDTGFKFQTFFKLGFDVEVKKVRLVEQFLRRCFGKVTLRSCRF